MEILSYLAYETVAQVTWLFRDFICVFKTVIFFTLQSVFPSDRGFVTFGEAGNDSKDESSQSCDLCQLHPLQHTR